MRLGDLYSEVSTGFLFSFGFVVFLDSEVSEDSALDSDALEDSVLESEAFKCFFFSSISAFVTAGKHIPSSANKFALSMFLL